MSRIFQRRRSSPALSAAPARRVCRQRRLSVQRLETRQLMAGDFPSGLDRPLGATYLDTAEVFLGRVVVTPVFLESDGSIDPESQDWTAGEIDSVLAKIEDGVNWWRETLDNLDSVHSLEFVIDATYADDPVEIGYEPIDRNSNFYTTYVNEFLNTVDSERSGTLDESMFAFNDAQRAKYGGDWSFTIFVVDSSDDMDGLFPATGSFRGAFALPGGLYMMLPSERPTRTIAHETGHLFWALDEYAGGGTVDQFRGYYNTQNLNAYDNPEPGFTQADSIMASDQPMLNAYLDHTSSPVTLAQIGWLDSDGDGIFDILDVPMSLTGAGWYDAATEQYRFVGEASAVPLMNQNSEGPQSDITLNRIRRLEVSVDEGPWQLLDAPNVPVAELDVSFALSPQFDSVRLRVVDDVTGASSAALVGTATLPIASAVPVRGVAFFDEDDDLARSSDESLLDSIVVELRASDGSPLRHGSFDIASAVMNANLPVTDGMTFSGDGMTFGDNVQARVDAGRTELPLIHIYDQQLDFWTPRLSDRGGLKVTMDAPVGVIEVDVVGLDRVAYARVEAYDAAGHLITRQTTDLRNEADGQLGERETQTLRLVDNENRIASIRVFGHASTWVGVTGVRHGVQASVTTDASGTVGFDGLADGVYQLIATPQRVIHAFEPQTVNVLDGQAVGDDIAGGMALLAARRIDSLRNNVGLPEDVNGDGIVSALDALQVINDVNLNDPRWLTFAESEGPSVDVNNDGRVSAIDALRVINRLNEEDQGGAGEPMASLPMASLPSASLPSASLPIPAAAISSPAALPPSAVAPVSTPAARTNDLAMAGWLEENESRRPSLGVETKHVSEQATADSTALVFHRS